MKYFIVSLLVLMVFESKMIAQTPVNVTGFTNHSLLIGTDSRPGEDAFDGETIGSATAFFYVNGYNPSGTSLTNGLPADGAITSSSNSGVNYQLNYTGKNSLKIFPDSTGTLTFSNSIAYSSIWLLGTSGNGTSPLTITVNYSDGTSDVTSGFTLPDWFGGTSSDSKIAKTNATGYYRIWQSGTVNNTNSFYFYDISVPVTSTKIISTISIKNTKAAGSNNRANIVAVCGMVNNLVQMGVNKYGTITTDIVNQVGINGQIGSSTKTSNGKKN